MRYLFALLAYLGIATTQAQTGRVGIRTTTPLSGLHVNDTSVLFSSPVSWFLPAGSEGTMPVEGSGVRMLWYGGKAAFRAGAVSALQWSKSNTGRYSAAFGLDNQAAGDFSFASGVNNEVPGWYSVALGSENKTSQTANAAIGTNNEIRNLYGSALGHELIVRAVNGLAVGVRNDTSDVQLPPGSSNLTDRIFQIGIGSFTERKNAMTVLANGRTGIGTTQPRTQLHVDKESVVFTGSDAWNLPNVLSESAPVEGAGVRMLWYGGRAAFRAGAVSGNLWNTTNVGTYSAAFGLDNFAGGEGSFSAGLNNTASNFYSIAMGLNNRALQVSSVAIGNDNTVRNFSSMALGSNLVVRSVGAVVVGAYNDTSDVQLPVGSSNTTDRIFQVGNGTVFGRRNAMTILANGNTGVGVLSPSDRLEVAGRLRLHANVVSAGLFLNNAANTVSAAFIGMANDNLVGFYGGVSNQWGLVMHNSTGNVGIGIGATNPARPLSFPPALGEKILLYPGSNGEVGIGVYGNELRLHCDNPGSKVSFGTQDNAGNFTELARAQQSGAIAFSVNGSIWANGTTYASDARFKSNIQSLDHALDQVKQLRGVSYHMDQTAFPQRHFAYGVQLGLIAQEVEQVVPQVVREVDGYKGVDYAQLVPLLIEAIKAQQVQIDRLEQKLNQREK